MSDFLFHKVNEKEKEEIKKQAKEIIDSFSKKLEKVKDLPKESHVERELNERKEGSRKKDSSFSREIMFSNASKKSKDFIIAEKKEW
jgi:Asp-tRNA(Asn)/Glu-tRNA(Gln) amidotransferase C subunit